MDHDNILSELERRRAIAAEELARLIGASEALLQIESQREDARKKLAQQTGAGGGTLSEIELQRVIPIKEAAARLSVSTETLRRHHADKILRLSPGRQGLRIRDVLAIGEKK